MNGRPQDCSKNAHTALHINALVDSLKLRPHKKMTTARLQTCTSDIYLCCTGMNRMEDTMRLIKSTVIAALATAFLGFAPAASAADVPTTDCSQMAKQLAEALQSTNANQLRYAAQVHAKAALDSCAAHRYDDSAASYARAVDLIARAKVLRS